MLTQAQEPLYKKSKYLLNIYICHVLLSWQQKDEYLHRVTQDNSLTMLPGLELTFDIDSLFPVGAKFFCNFKPLKLFIF